MTKASTIAQPATRTPRPVSGCDVRRLPITPRQAFLLSRIDGALNEAELANLTGFDIEEIRANVDRLAALGAVHMDLQQDANARISRTEISEQAAPAPGIEALRTSQTFVRKLRYDPRALEEPGDLDIESRRKVLDCYAQLSELDYYALLGVAEGADKKEIKRAYYRLAPDFHPDRFYGKDLGSFKAKLETIFGKLTLAYETLSSADRKTEYDGYLATQRSTRSMEALLEQASPPGAPDQSPSTPASPVTTPPTSGVQANATAQAPSAPAPTASQPTFSAPASAPVPRPAPPITPSRQMPVVNPSSPGMRSPEEERARREALARKLGGGRVSLAPDPARATPPPNNPEAAVQELKRMRDFAVQDSRKSQIRRHMEAGKAALGQNPAAAANAFKLALTLDPTDPEIIAAHQHASQIAAAALADGYLKQGDYESRAGHWPEAARSYARAAAGMPNDATVLLKAAGALLKASGDLRQAAEFAKRAVSLSGKRLDPRITLIEVYLAASMPLAAKKELEQAREIAPRDDRIAELLKRLK